MEKKQTQWERSMAENPENEKAVINLMIDFETTGIHPETCGIMSVAIIGFDPLATKAEKVYCSAFASIESNWILNRDVSSSQQWWNNPDRSTALSLYLESSELQDVSNLEKMVVDVMSDLAKEGSELILWSRGHFDIAIIEEIFRRNNMEFGVPYYNIRDVRTFILEHHIDESRLMNLNEVEHVALHDCKRYIREIQYINKTLYECGFFSKVDAVTSEENRRRIHTLREMNK